MKTLPAKSFFFEKDKNLILQKFKSILDGKSFLSQYKYSEKFEKDFCSYTNAKYSLSCNSGTSALELIFKCINVKNKEVIIPSNTFLATALGIINEGGFIKFADCNSDMCLSYESVVKNYSSKTKAVVIVHIGGIISKDIFKIRKFCKLKKIYLIEDAAQAHGSKIKKQFAGTFGDFGAFSFYSTKIITTGEGGMVTFTNKKYLKKIKSLREFGKVKKGFYINYHKHIGYNWRFQEVNAILGIYQLKRTKEFIKKRESLSKIYLKYFSNHPGIEIVNPNNTYGLKQNFYKFIISLKKYNRVNLQKKLKKLKHSLSGYVYEYPLHKQPIFKEYNYLNLPNTQKLCANHICLPMYYELSEKKAIDLSKKILLILSD